MLLGLYNTFQQFVLLFHLIDGSWECTFADFGHSNHPAYTGEAVGRLTDDVKESLIDDSNRLQYSFRTLQLDAQERSGGQYVPKMMIKNLRRRAKVASEQAELQTFISSLHELGADEELHHQVLMCNPYAHNGNSTTNM